MKKAGAGLLVFLFALSTSVMAQLINPAQKKETQVKKLEVIEPTSIKLNQTEVYVFYNPGIFADAKEGYKLVATILPENATSKEVVWESSDPAIVEVSKDGYLTPLKYGSVMVTATARANGIKAQCRVYVQRRNEPFGNTSSHLNNSGYLAVQNDWIYFANPSDNMSLYKMKLDGSERKKLSQYSAKYINVIGNQVYYQANNAWIHKIDIYGENTKVLNPNQVAVFLMATPKKIFYLSLDPNGRYAIYYVDPEGMERGIIDWNWPRHIAKIFGDGDRFIFFDSTQSLYRRYKLNTSQWSEPDIIYESILNDFVLEMVPSGVPNSVDYFTYAYIIDPVMNAIKKVGPIADKEKRKTQVLFASPNQSAIERIAEAEEWLFYCKGKDLNKIKKDGSQNQVIYNNLPEGEHFIYPVRISNQPNDLWIYVYTQGGGKYSLFKIRQNGMDRIPL
ncbi:MAG: hypothetical protein C0168_08750 [Candidatus Aminicenantes bacterium]|nr:MAG: hypothetical protein C0168_08750 [Candidatus Aminicenantes bacterium]